MLKKTIRYTDFNGDECVEDYYFNLNSMELAETEFGVDGGFSDMLNNITASEDNARIVRVFKDLILKSYGEKSPDGKKFIKSEELSDEFSQTAAFGQLCEDLLAGNGDSAVEFIKGILPAKIADSLNVPTGEDN